LISGVGGLSAILGRIPLHDARPTIPPFVLFDFSGLGIELGGHQSQPLGTGEIEATPGDPEAVFGLAAQKLGCQHYWIVFFSQGRSGVGLVQWF
jgi:hypothetical protein